MSDITQDSLKIARALDKAVNIIIDYAETAMDAVHVDGIARAQMWRNIRAIAEAKAVDIERPSVNLGACHGGPTIARASASGRIDEQCKLCGVIVPFGTAFWEMCLNQPSKGSENDR